MRPFTEAAFKTLIERHLLAHGYISRPHSGYLAILRPENMHTSALGTKP